MRQVRVTIVTNEPPSAIVCYRSGKPLPLTGANRRAQLENTAAFRCVDGINPQSPHHILVHHTVLPNKAAPSWVHRPSMRRVAVDDASFKSFARQEAVLKLKSLGTHCRRHVERIEMSGSKKTIVLGGAGDVGEGIVRQLRHAGHHVGVPSRSQSKLDALERVTAGSGKLTGAVGAIDDPALANDMATRMGPVDMIVASIGSWWSGPPLIDVSVDDFNSVLAGSLTAHYTAARAFLPLVRNRDGGQYIFINGGAARMAIPGSGLVSISAAAQEMLKSVLAQEHSKDPISISTLMLFSMVKTRSRPDGPPEWLSADDVGRQITHMLDHAPQTGATITLAKPSDIPA